MKKIPLVLTLAVFTAGIAPLAGAAEAERHVEKRIVVSADSTPGAAAAPREPVTFLGVEAVPASGALAAQLRLPEGHGLVVQYVVPDSPAAAAGLARFDVLLKLDDQLLIEPRQLAVLVRGHKDGDAVTLTYLRAGAEAHASVTLGEHTPPDDEFGWTGEEGGDRLFFQQDFFDGPHMGVSRARSRWIENTPEASPAPMPFVTPLPEMPDVPPAPGAPRAPRVMIFRPRANIVFSDESGSLELRVDDGKHVLTAKNPGGAVVFTGPVDTPDQRAAMPEDLRARLEKLETMEVFEFDPPAAPAPAATPAPPAPPAAPPHGGITQSPARPANDGSGAQIDRVRIMIL